MWIRATGAVLRMIVGAALVYLGVAKLLDPTFLYGGVVHLLETFGRPFDFYRDYVILRLVERHQEVFAFGVPIAEIAIGLAFLFGGLVSWAAVGGVFLLVNFALATGQGAAWTVALHAAMAVLLLALGRAGAGLTWGLDGWLIQRWPAALVLFPLRRRAPDDLRRTQRAPARNYPGQVHGRGR